MALKEQIGAASTSSRQPLRLGDEQYLWILVLLEVGVLATLRSTFRRNHGG